MPRNGSSQILVLLVASAFGQALAQDATPPPGFATLAITNAPAGGGYSLRVDLTRDANSYYTLLRTRDFRTFEAAEMTLARGAGAVSLWEVPLPISEEPQLFWSVRELSIFGPTDSDGDGIDDVFELRSGLDPRDASDASTVKSGDTRTWLQVYQADYGREPVSPSAVSREVSLFNESFATSSVEVVSREVSVFNLSLPVNVIEAISREISVRNSSN